MREQVIDAPWPTVDESALVQEKKVMPVQVNGRLRGQIEVAVDADRDEIANAALENPGVLRHVEGKTIKKTIIVPEKLVNIVT